MRRIIQVLSIVSLLLCFCSIALWVRSYWRIDEVDWIRRTRTGTTGLNSYVNLRSSLESCSVTTQWYKSLVVVPRDWPADGVTTKQYVWRSWDITKGGAPWIPRRGMLYFSSQKIERQDLVSRNVVVPHWFLCAVFALIPAFQLHRLFVRKQQPGMCSKCGYDLRATPDRCPECGCKPGEAS